MENKIIAKNPTARRNYLIQDTFEAGIVLSGTEIKSIRNGKVNIKDTYVMIKNGEAYIYGMHISPYEHGNIFNKDPLRDRKLLLHKREIYKLFGMIKQKGISLIPLTLYFICVLYCKYRYKCRFLFFRNKINQYLLCSVS